MQPISIITILFRLSILTHLSLALDFQQGFLIPHNKARDEVGVHPLTWNQTVATYAYNYASQRLKDCELEHSDGPFGENLAGGYGDWFTATDAVNMWVGEKPSYDYGSNSCIGDECHHYTQVVWRDSVHLGCAKQKCHNGWWFVICNYDPPGNYVGQRPY